MISASQIREVVWDYINNGDAQRFVLEFSQLSFNIRQTGTVAAQDLSRNIQETLAQVYLSHMTQPALKAWLRNNVAPVGYEIAAIGVVHQPSEQNMVNRPVGEIAFPASAGSFGTLFGVESSSTNLARP
jgi:hypothetical protein